MKPLMVLVLASILSLLSLASASEVGALIAFKNAIVHDPDNDLKNWDPYSSDPCYFNHIECTDGSVTAIYLTNLGLVGTLVPELANLPNLKYLDLGKNHFTGAIPAELGQLTNLFALELMSNQMLSSVPPSLAALPSLRILRLENNNLSGPLHTSFAKFPVDGFAGNPGLCGPVVQKPCS